MGHAIGIDLGTTNSVVAVMRDGSVDIIADPDGNTLHPSVVAFMPDGRVIVGSGAVERRHIDPQNTIYSAKRLIGQNIRNPLVQMVLSGLPYEVLEGGNQRALICIRDRQYEVPEISAIVVRYLKDLAEYHLGEEVTQAVITVPANFTDSQRQATRQAGALAGLEVMRILNEPTAAALAYGFGQNIDSNVAVFDLGGGTFDVTALHVEQSVFEVLATGGDPFLGGDDFDRALVDRLAGELLEHELFDARDNPAAWAILRDAAEQIKIRLSDYGDAAGTIQELGVGADGRAISLPFEVTREQFEEIITPYVAQAMKKCREVLNAAGISISDLDDFILVGGSTRTPLVRLAVTSEFGIEPRDDINPDEIVAFGAAIQAGVLSGVRQAPGVAPALLIDVCPRGLGVRVAGGFNETVIEANTPMPVERTRTFSTSHDNQDSVMLQVSQGEERMFDDNEVLGELTLAGITPRPRGDSKIEVTFTIDADGILAVRAVDKVTNVETVATLHTVAAPSVQ